MKSELAKDMRPFLTEGQNVGRVLTERGSYKLDISNELLMTEELRAERSSEGEVRVKYLSYQCGVGVVPHLLVEDAHNFLLPRPGDLCEIQRRVVHARSVLCGLTTKLAGAPKARPG